MKEDSPPPGQHDNEQLTCIRTKVWVKVHRRYSLESLLSEFPVEVQHASHQSSFVCVEARATRFLKTPDPQPGIVVRHDTNGCYGNS